MLSHPISLEMAPFDTSHTSSYSSSIVIMDILVKNCIFHTPFYIITLRGKQLRIFSHYFSTTEPCTWPLRWCEHILQKVLCLLTGCACHRLVTYNVEIFVP